MVGTISIPMEESAAFDRKEFDWHSIATDIAEECSCLISDIEEMPSQERHQLKQGAQIKAFIPLRAVDQVKELSIRTIPMPGTADSGRKRNDCSRRFPLPIDRRAVGSHDGLVVE